MQQPARTESPPEGTHAAPDRSALLVVLGSTLWFVTWCVVAVALLRSDWPTPASRQPVGLGALVLLLAVSYLLAARLRRLDASVRERYAAALAHTNALLRDLVDQDDLTGLHNRRSFLRRLDQEMARARRTGEAFSVILADLNGFKQVNDRAGHQIGDDVLRAWGARLRDAVRETDVVCRIGGDEFAVLAPATDPAAAGQLCARLRALNLLVADAGGHLVGVPPLSACFGVATYDPGIMDVSHLLSRADQALYAEKRALPSTADRERAPSPHR